MKKMKSVKNVKIKSKDFLNVNVKSTQAIRANFADVAEN